MGNILFVDGNSLFYQMNSNMEKIIIGENGLPIQGIIGFIGALLKIIKQSNPTHVLVIFNTINYENSNQKEADAQDHQQPKQGDITLYIDDIKKALRRLQIQYYEIVEETQTREFIASCVKNFSNYKKIIVSNDNAFIQLINNSTFVYIYREKGGVLLDEKRVLARCGYHPYQYSSFKSLLKTYEGDNAVSNITIKTVVRLLSEYKDITDILENINSLKPFSIRTIINDSKDMIIKNHEQAKINAEIMIPFKSDSFIYKPIKEYLTMPLLYDLKIAKCQDKKIKTSE